MTAQAAATLAAALLPLASALAAEPRGTGDLGIVVERAAGLGHDRRDHAARRPRPGRGPGRPQPRLGGVRPRRPPRLRLRPRRRSHQGRSSRAGGSSSASSRPATRSAAPSPRTGGWSPSRTTSPAGFRSSTPPRWREVADIPSTLRSTTASAPRSWAWRTPPAALRLEPLRGRRDLVRRPRRPGAPPGSSASRTSAGCPTTRYVTPDGRYYVAGLFGEDGLAVLDLWDPSAGRAACSTATAAARSPAGLQDAAPRGLGRGRRLLFLPAVGRHELLLSTAAPGRRSARIPVHGQPVFAVARPDGRQVWVNFAHPANDVVQVIDVPSRAVAADAQPGQGRAPPRVHARAASRSGSRRATPTRSWSTTPPRATVLREIPADKPSGIFFTARANRIGF